MRVALVDYDSGNLHSAEKAFQLMGRDAGAEVVVVKNGPHGFNVSHAAEFNAALLAFLAR